MSQQILAPRRPRGTLGAPMNTLRTAILGAALAAIASPLHAENWAGFRGNSGSGISTEKNLPVKWSATSGLKWKVALPGRASSSPVATSKRIYLTTQTKDLALWVIAFDKTTGKEAWRKRVASGALAAKGPKNLYAHRHNPATSTPVADDSHVWAFFGTGHLVCLDAAGKQIWARNLAKEYGAYDVTFGMGSSPRLWKGKLYIACMTKGASYVAALNPATGKTLWKKNRRLPAKDDGPDAYSTPVIWRGNTGDELLIAGSDHINSYHPVNGQQLWVSGGFTIKSPYGRIIASPAVSPGVIVQCSANPGDGGLGRAIALRAGQRGNITTSARLWTLERTTPDSSTPVILDGRAYLVRGNGITLCLDLATGRKLWTERLAQGQYFSAAVAGDGKVYILNTTGACTVLQSGAKFSKLAENKLPGTFYSTPAISNGKIFLRSENTLYAVGK